VHHFISKRAASSTSGACLAEQSTIPTLARVFQLIQTNFLMQGLGKQSYEQVIVA
jgi:hypothetical protein